MVLPMVSSKQHGITKIVSKFLLLPFVPFVLPNGIAFKRGNTNGIVLYI